MKTEDVNYIKRMLLAIFCVLMYMAGMVCADIAWGAELSVGTSYMPNGHSEGSHQRCMNDGWGIDFEYKIPVEWDLNEWVGFGLTPGAMLTYSRFETAYRKTASSPESRRKQESGYTLMATLRPTVRLWRVRGYPLLGLGYDYNEPDNAFDLGYIRYGYGGGIDIAEDWALDVSARKFKRFDGTSYTYNTITLSWEF